MRPRSAQDPYFANQQSSIDNHQSISPPCRADANVLKAKAVSDQRSASSPFSAVKRPLQRRKMGHSTFSSLWLPARPRWNSETDRRKPLCEVPGQGRGRASPPMSRCQCDVTSRPLSPAETAPGRCDQCRLACGVSLLGGCDCARKKHSASGHSSRTRGDHIEALVNTRCK